MTLALCVYPPRLGKNIIDEQHFLFLHFIEPGREIHWVTAGHSNLASPGVSQGVGSWKASKIENYSELNTPFPLHFSRPVPKGCNYIRDDKPYAVLDR